MKKLYYLFLLLISFSAAGKEGKLSKIHDKQEHVLNYLNGVIDCSHDCYIKELPNSNVDFKVYSTSRNPIIQFVTLLSEGTYDEKDLKAYEKDKTYIATFRCEDFCTKLYNDKAHIRMIDNMLIH